VRPLRRGPLLSQYCFNLAAFPLNFAREFLTTFVTILAVIDEEKCKAERAKAAQGQLVVVRPDEQYLLLPALRKDSVSAEMVASVERMMPSTVKRNVAAIGDTTWAAGKAPKLETANRAIPFFGLLIEAASTVIGRKIAALFGRVVVDFAQTLLPPADTVKVVVVSAVMVLPNGGDFRTALSAKVFRWE
jgi:hypothetical protein